MEETVSPQDILQKTEDTTPDSDVFLWANNLVQIKEEIQFEFFFFNKNYVLYKVNVDAALRRGMEVLILDGLVEAVLDGAEQGMVVRSFEEAEAEKNVLQRTKIGNVDNAKIVFNFLHTQAHEIEHFVEDDHDFKRLKGMLVRCSHKSLEKPFYVIKSLPQSNLMKGKDNWMLRNGKFVQFDAEGALKIPADNQLLVIEHDIYAFNPAKLSTVFGYDAKKYTIADIKLKLIAQNFRLSISEEQTIEEMVRGKKSVVNKLQKVDPTGITQEDLINHAEELDLPLMVDDKGAIIIMDGKDLSVFVNLLNEDYIESALTGARYEITGKKPLKPPTDDDLLKQYS